MKEIAVSEKTALLIKPRDPLDIGKKVIVLLENPKIAAQLSKQVQQESLKYSIETNTSSLSNLYMRIMGITIE